ncbi:hypothetical protein PLESTB_000568400 [Pleodorina starrii]|uniref:Thioredoxin domain-containing protein n=1 Tax=Pleodorina starrii TaxID=330485 RepID=A0A9W6BH68_9CHLO|nr:hypothetical protein PLESTM_000316100 [Pleodorina starrii]GLC51969.1 hypothetical protein PLESTB_000568400 [Pleodorina starrii]GLC68547.1 hypothetical protein PLESTF_000704300 [Pleodorina starrii]
MATPNLLYVTTKAEWDSRLATAKAENKVSIVDFFAQWCGPCKVIASVYESLAKDHPNIYFLKVDVDCADMASVAEACGITAMPTFQVFIGGAKVDELVGASQEKLKALVAKYASGVPADKH